MNEQLYNIKHNYQYRANPNNRFHDTYQSMVDRVFCVFLFLMFEVGVWAHTGIEGVMMSVPIMLVAGSALFIFIVVSGAFLDIVFAFFDWLAGN